MFLWTAPVPYIIQIGLKIYKIWAKLQYALKQSIAFTAPIFTYLTNGQQYCVEVLRTKLYRRPG